MGDKVVMTYAIIQAAISQFDATAMAMHGVAAVAKAVADSLRASFFGAVFGAEVIRRMDLIHDKAEKLAKLCEKFSANLKKAMNDHKTGDYEEGSYFGGEVSA